MTADGGDGIIPDRAGTDRAPSPSARLRVRAATGDRFSGPPEGLDPAIAGLWPGLAADCREMAGGAEADMVILAQVVRAMDRLEAIRRAIEAEGVTVAGSTGQVRGHPLLTVEARLRAEVVQGLQMLGLAPSQTRRHSATVTRAGRLVRPR